MSLPEGYLPREGDILVLHGTTKFDVYPGEPNVFVTIGGRHSALSVDLDQIVGLHCRKWDVDARVIWQGSEGVVAAVYGSVVWVRFGSGSALSFETVEANDLQPAPEVKEIEEVLEPPAPHPVLAPAPLDEEMPL